ncbi:MAG: 30S ribosomal protein S6 [Calothrix sp. MO_167.B42]|nr:30S ribosomal protein S6 [Calothrix sp. MO_167.B42]
MSVFYETMYILRPDMGDEQVSQAIAKYENLIREAGANDIEIQNRGKRRLAYEIDRHRDGIYIQMNYTGPGKIIAPMERAMRLSEEVIRYLTIKQDNPQGEVTEVEETEAATPV